MDYLISKIVNKILPWIRDLFQALIDFLYRLMLTLFDFFKDFFWWILDSLFKAIILVMDSLSISLNSISPLTYISAIPDTTKYYMAAAGFNECMGMVVAAITVRILLRLIPFVRLGG